MEIEINVCPGTLKPGYHSYSPRCLKDVFNGSQVDHVLPFDIPETEKPFLSVKLHRRKLSLEEGGQYLLKPIPQHIINADQYPANAQLTMQIAAQVFNIPTVKAALIFLVDGTPAYITKRFDIGKDGKEIPAEDFASLANLNKENAGVHYKYGLSYLNMAEMIDKLFPASIPAKEFLFKIVVFNYLFCNGDANLENFSCVDPKGNGDWQLAPAYNLVNTGLHGDDSDLALLDGLYQKDFDKRSYRTLGFYAYDDFFLFGMKMGLLNFRVKRFMDQLLDSQDEVRDLVQRSYLRDDMKAEYLRLYDERHKKLSNSLSGLRLS
jgi:serine/threonine-protein kinase HipA